MILSDRTLREQLDAGRIIIDPLGPNSLQPSSIDLRLDRFFRVFKNHAMGHIDVKQNLDELKNNSGVPRDVLIQAIGFGPVQLPDRKQQGSENLSAQARQGYLEVRYPTAIWSPKFAARCPVIQQ